MAQTVTIPNITGAETISGPWTFTGVTVLPTVTRRVTIPAQMMAQINGTAIVLTTQGTYPDAWAQWPLASAPAAAPQALYAAFGVPMDYSSGGTFYVIYSQSGVAVTLWRVEVNYANLADLGDPTLASSVIGISLTPDGVINRVQIDQIGAVGAPVTAGNWLRLSIERDSAHADDVNADTIRLIGVIFEYVATR